MTIAGVRSFSLGCLVLTALGLANTPSRGAVVTDGLYICAEHADPDDWDSEFANGPLVVPAGAVFDYAGHIIGGNLQDPRDSARFDMHGWKGISSEENARRSNLLSQDMAIDNKNKSGLVTTIEVVLTKAAPCALAQAEVILSKNWGWTIAPIRGDDTLYYQIFGVIRRGALDTDFADDSVPLNFVAARGELNASVRGTITKTLNLDQWSASQPPNNAPVQGKGNSECWGDESRQDISCRALTEDLLMSLRRATKAEVIKAMNVSGREIERGLHFLSNYSSGQRWGSGDVNFLFDNAGRVSVIFASLTSPNSDEKDADFIWNMELLPDGCSDLPHTSMKHCP
jgi:hypothetical protein